jgi:hypothetical protein
MTARDRGPKGSDHVQDLAEDVAVAPDLAQRITTHGERTREDGTGRAIDEVVGRLPAGRPALF